MHDNFQLKRDAGLSYRCIETVIDMNEGGYSNDPLDRGGETMFGITKAVAVAHGYLGEMRDMPRHVAVEIYNVTYWNPMFDYLPPAVAFNLLDARVNHGVPRATKALQEIVGEDQDGIFGEKTFNSLIKYDQNAFILAFCLKRIYLYSLCITARDHANGWNNRIIKNLKHTGHMIGNGLMHGVMKLFEVKT